MKKLYLFIILILIALGCIIIMQPDVCASDSNGNLVIVLDPGHGGSDPGAMNSSLGITEATVNYKLAVYAKTELEKYEGVKVYLTRYSDCPTIYERGEIAKKYNADLVVSLHINSGSSSARGAAVWVTQDNTQVEYYQKSKELGEKILNQISKLGISNNGVQTRSGKANEWYSSGVVKDYYGIIRYPMNYGIRSILVEHCYISNSSDCSYINSDSKIKKLATADVKGIVEAYNLKEKGTGSVPVKEISIDKTELNLEITSSDSQPVNYLNVVFSPSNATNQEVEWYSSDSSIVRVYEGKIRGLKEGEVTIKAISKNNQRIATCKVVVTKPKNALKSISVDNSNIELSIQEKTHINVKFNPSNCSDKTLYWTSSNPEVVRVWDGDIRGLKEGVSTITATSRAGAKQVSCKVVVKDSNKIYVEKITPEQEEYTIGVGDVIDINYSYSPSNASNTDFSWTATDSSVLRVYWNRIRGLKAGTTEIIVKTPEGSLEKRIKVTVQKVKTQIKLESSEYTINKNESININCTYTPSSLTANDFSWTSSDSSVLRVYWNKIRGLKKGTAYVIIKSLDGTVEKKIKVTVKNTQIKIEPEQEEYTISQNEAININCTYSPSSITKNDFSWTSSDSNVLRVYWDRIRGLKKGTAYIIVKSLDGSVEKKIKVTVK